MPIDHTPHHAQITADGFRNLIKRSVPMAEYLGAMIASPWRGELHNIGL